MHMRYITLILLPIVLLGGCSGRVLDKQLQEWNVIEVAVRDQIIEKYKAKTKLKALLADLSKTLQKKYGFEKGTWTFPLEGYGTNSIGKNGFKPQIFYGPYGIKGYDYFDGNKHGGHPAYDIFIKDKNQDSMDDRTGKNVKVLAMTDMLVLSVESGWKTGDSLRGGNYIWLFNPVQKKLFYYAHLNEIYVAPGEFVKKGGILGAVGRTGFSAAKKRSPTHLHLMVLDTENASLNPVDYLSMISK